MSKYTSNDDDVKAMDPGDRVQYEFDLLEHNVDKMVEASYATMAMKDKSMIKEQLKNPKKVYLGIIMLLVYTFVVVFLILFIIWFILKLLGKDKSINLRKVMVSIMCMLLLLIIITLIINSMQANMVELVEMTKEPVKGDD